MTKKRHPPSPILIQCPEAVEFCVFPPHALGDAFAETVQGVYRPPITPRASCLETMARIEELSSEGAYENKTCPQPNKASSVL